MAGYHVSLSTQRTVRRRANRVWRAGARRVSRRGWPRKQIDGSGLTVDTGDDGFANAPVCLAP